MKAIKLKDAHIGIPEEHEKYIPEIIEILEMDGVTSLEEMTLNQYKNGMITMLLINGEKPKEINFVNLD